MKCNASELQNKCKMRSQNNMTGVKFKDKEDLEKKIANAQLEYGKKYWTALRYDQVNHKRGSQVNKLLTINYPWILVGGSVGQNKITHVQIAEHLWFKDSLGVRQFK